MFRSVLFRSIAISCLIASTTLAGPKITTGSKTGTYIRVGQNIWHICGFKSDDVLTSVGSGENIERLINDQADLAIIQADAIEYNVTLAKELEDDDRVRALSQINLIMPLYLEEIQILVRADANIKSLKDLAGKRVNVGVKGSGNSITSRIIADRLNIAWIAQNESTQKSIANVALGRADATIIVGGVPYSHLTAMLPEWKRFVKLLPIENEPQLDGLYIPTAIPAKTYSWQPNKIPTYGVPSILVTSSDTDPEVIKAVLLAIYDGIQPTGFLMKAELTEDEEGADITPPHAKWKEIKSEFLTKSLSMGIPVHAKASYYFPLMQLILGNDPTKD